MNSHYPYRNCFSGLLKFSNGNKNAYSELFQLTCNAVLNVHRSLGHTIKCILKYPEVQLAKKWQNEENKDLKTFSLNLSFWPEDRWSCIAHLSTVNISGYWGKVSKYWLWVTWTKVNEWPWPLILIKLRSIDCIYQLLYHKLQ